MQSTQKKFSPVGRWVALAGVPVGTWFAQPEISIALVLMGITCTALIMGTALFGNDRHSDRAFRLLRWIAGRPEPDAPGTVTESRHQQG